MNPSADGPDLVASLRAEVETTLRPLLGDVERTALVEFPDYSNPGDSAIYLGQLACLEALRLPSPCFVSDGSTYHPEALGRRLGDGTILLAGGGNFGDLWEEQQRFRERVIRDFPRNRIVQLPQSIHFRHREALDRARRAVDGHPDFIFLARERRSLEIARREFSAPVTACPDMALCLGPLPGPDPSAGGILWLARTDREARETGSAGPACPPDVRRTDWIAETPTRLDTLAAGLAELCRRMPGASAPRRALMAAYVRLARRRLRRGCRVLSGCQVLVTDRLHGHILALLMGVPHVLHDNIYGKLSSFHRTWTCACPLVRFAASPGEALDEARRLATRLRDGPAGSPARGSCVS